MTLEVDHAFIACAPGAPEADALVRLGLKEGPPNTHPGQGTANRRFFFENFMLELLWVVDPKEVTSAQTRRTRLWERCSNRTSNNPFGIIFRAAREGSAPAPFPTWSYCPDYLPEGFSIEIATETTLHEPELFYLPFVRGARGSVAEQASHGRPWGALRGISVGVQSLAALSAASRTAERSGLLTYFEALEPVLEIHFTGLVETRLDLRPELPLIFTHSAS